MAMYDVETAPDPIADEAERASLVNAAISAVRDHYSTTNDGNKTSRDRKSGANKIEDVHGAADDILRIVMSVILPVCDYL